MIDKVLFGIGMNDGDKVELPDYPFEVYTFDSDLPEVAGLEMVVTCAGDYVEFNFNGDPEHPVALMAREIMWYRTLQMKLAVVDNRELKD